MLWHTLEQMQPVWLLAALAAELVAYVGYVVAYRSTILAQRPWAPLGMAICWAAEIACFGFALRCFGGSTSRSPRSLSPMPPGTP